jgi:hypothetical protein
MSDIAYGSSNEPGLPPVNLPSFDSGQPQQIPRITINARPQPKPTPAPYSFDKKDGAWSATTPDFKAPEPVPQDTSSASADGAFGASLPDHAAATEATPQAPAREVGSAEAGFYGLADSATFGLYPAIAGLANASGIPAAEPGPGEEPGGIDVNPIRPIVGAAKMLHNWLSEHPDEAVREAYNKGREAALVDQNLAQQQHPAVYLAGQLGGALATPGLGILKGATATSRIMRGVAAGTTAGGLYGGGSAISEDQSPIDVAKSAGLGAATGAGFGGAGSVGAELTGAAGRKAMSIYRGGTNTDAEAARKIVAAQADDFARTGPVADPAAIAAGNAAGTPRAIVDDGGQHTRDLARSAGNVSSDAWDRLTHYTQQRFEDQSPRIAGFIRRMFGGRLDSGADQIALKSAGAKLNRGAYKRAYTAGDRPIWSPELERLSGSPAVQRALAGAVERGKDRAIKDGMGGFNPGVHVTEDGRVLFTKPARSKGASQSERLEAEMNGRPIPPSGGGAVGGNGVQTYPNLQFWDYAQRELRDSANAAGRAGRNEEAATLNGLTHDLNAELDKRVPEFKAARQGAAAFFGAENASEAGEKFVMMNANLGEAGRALAKMSDPERELFARGFASELANRVMKVGDTTNILDKVFIDSHEARRKIAMALGPNRARALEALLRVESIVDRSRTAFGNSTTARQLKQLGMSAGHGIAGAGAVAGLEGIREHDYNPTHLVMAALTFGAAKHGAHIIDEKVARRVAEMLVSNDASILQKGMQIVERSPIYFNALRRVTASNSRIAAHDIGPERSAAGAIAGASALFHEGDVPTHIHSVQ